MNVSETFIARMLEEMQLQGLSEAQLSQLAGLNRRAVTDLREGRTKSPKLSTAFAIAGALGKDPTEMFGLERRHQICKSLATHLEQYSESEQEALLIVLKMPRQESCGD